MNSNVMASVASCIAQPRKLSSADPVNYFLYGYAGCFLFVYFVSLAPNILSRGYNKFSVSQLVPPLLYAIVFGLHSNFICQNMQFARIAVFPN